MLFLYANHSKSRHCRTLDTMRSRSFILIFTIYFCIALRNDISVLALAIGPPILGIGAVLFRPRNVKFVKSSEKDGEALDEAGKFFVDAFW